MVAPEKYPRRAARLRAKKTLVQVSAAAGCAINTAAKYEVAPETVRDDRRVALDAVYDGLAAATTEAA